VTPDSSAGRQPAKNRGNFASLIALNRLIPNMKSAPNIGKKIGKITTPTHRALFTLRA